MGNIKYLYLYKFIKLVSFGIRIWTFYTSFNLHNFNYGVCKLFPVPSASARGGQIEKLSRAPRIKISSFRRFVDKN